MCSLISYAIAFSFHPILQRPSLLSIRQYSPFEPPLSSSCQNCYQFHLRKRRPSPCWLAKGGDGSESDEGEWQALLAALKLYKTAYGDLKVPFRFIVPSLAPWPEIAFGLKLGNRVAAIRSTGKYIENNEQRRKILDDMGFLWRLRAPSTSKDNTNNIPFEQLYDALVAYRENMQPGKGPLNVPPSFVVPDCDPWPEKIRSLPLGRNLSTLRSKAFLEANPDAKQKLLDINFQMDGKVAANDARFQNVYLALQRYKEIYGDLLIPQPFVVPGNSKAWPEETWGLRLGARVNAIRSQGTFVNSNPERRVLLDELGFVWSPPKSERGNRRGRRRKEEIAAMEGREENLSEQSDTDKPSDQLEATKSEMDSLFGGNFDFGKGPLPIIGQDGEMDSPVWGLEGGPLQDAARRAEEEAQAAEDYKPPKQLAESLAEAAEKAIEVGVIEDMTEDSRIRKGKREKNIPWFNDDFGDEFVFEDVVEALTIYKSMYGDFSNFTDDSFVVPSPGDSDSDSFIDASEDMFNIDAATRAAAAIANFGPEGIVDDDALMEAEMERLDSGTAVDSTVGEAELLLAMQTTKTAEWPEHLSGMALGNIVSRIRDGSLEVKHLPERKAQLDAIDFDWGDPKFFIDVPFEKAMCAMYAYYLVRGDMFVYEDFVMPDEDPWPQALAGYEIGKAVHRIRELQNFLEAYHPEKVSLLRMIDFVWFPTLALPLDPDEPEMTPEMLLLSAMGHPDYAKMIDIPMGLPDKIVADGPFFETDDPKLWWRKWHNWDYVQDYWYQQGRRDNAFVLRGMGYHQMADEHEEKYGPGLFKQINETMQALETGTNDFSDTERKFLVEKLQFFRQEMTDCTDIHPQDRKKLLEDLDSRMLDLISGSETDVVNEKQMDELEYEYEEADVEDEEWEEEYEEEYEEEEEDQFDEEDIEEDDFNVEEELGLGRSKK